jgi:hypothetical protein
MFISALRTAAGARRLVVTLAIGAAAWLVPATSGADTLLGGNFGYFVLQSEDARETGDVLYENLDFLAFDLDDFNNVTVGGEYLLGLGRFVEAGAGAGFYQRTVPSVYDRLVENDGSEIEQDLKLRVSPVTFTARLFPVGRDGGIQPYVGGGIAILAWRYSESGEFVFPGNVVRRETFVDSGNETAPVFFGGVRFPAGDRFLVGGEFRWHGGSAELDPEQEFAGDRLDLGAFTAQATFHVRF